MYKVRVSNQLAPAALKALMCPERRGSDNGRLIAPRVSKHDISKEVPSEKLPISSSRLAGYRVHYARPGWLDCDQSPRGERGSEYGVFSG